LNDLPTSYKIKIGRDTGLTGTLDDPAIADALAQ